MGAHFSIKPGPVGGGPANASYITRSQAAGDGDELYHNAPEAVESADTWRETKICFRSWAERVEAEERARHGNRAGQPRTHYRAVISYEDEIPTEAVKEDVGEFLEREFPQAKAVAVVQQDTDHSHAHVWMSARKTNGKKVHIGNGDLQEMHATMDEIYERRMGVESRNAEKVEETKEFRRTLAQMKEEGASKEELSRWAQENRPDRASTPGREVFRKREKRLAKTPEGASKEVSGRVMPEGLLKLKEAAGRVEEALEELEEGLEGGGAAQKKVQAQPRSQEDQRDAQEPVQEPTQEEAQDQTPEEQTLEEQTGKIREAMREGNLKGARRALRRLDADWDDLSADQKRKIAVVVAEFRRRDQGTQAAYEALSEKEKDIARDVQRSAIVEPNDIYADNTGREDMKKRIGGKLSEISGDGGDLLETESRIRQALPPKPGRALQMLQEATEVAQYRINTTQESQGQQSKDRSESQKQSQSKGGQGRGRSRGL